MAKTHFRLDEYPFSQVETLCPVGATPENSTIDNDMVTCLRCANKLEKLCRMLDNNNLSICTFTCEHLECRFVWVYYLNGIRRFEGKIAFVKELKKLTRTSLKEAIDRFVKGF